MKDQTQPTYFVAFLEKHLAAKPKYILSSKTFELRADAERYANTIAKARKPKILEG